MSLKPWILATRPKTLPAGSMPVVIAGSIAYFYGSFNWWLFLITLVCSVLIQIITNYINEIYDFKKGADTEERLGPQRMVASGVISVQQMTVVSIILIIITFALGLILVYYSDWIILAIGVLSLFFAYAYTGGPFPLAYLGIGDIFVLIFFGIFATGGTFYILTCDYNMVVFLASLGPGFLSMNLLGVNNIRDIETDIKAGKMTLAVRLGRKYANYLYILLMVGTFFVPFAVGHLTQSLFNLLPVLSLPLGIKLCKDVIHKQGRDLIKVLEDTGKLLLIYGFLTTLGFILAKIF